jgi:hypothetical protein
VVLGLSATHALPSRRSPSLRLKSDMVKILDPFEFRKVHKSKKTLIQKILALSYNPIKRILWKLP